MYHTKQQMIQVNKIVASRIIDNEAVIVVPDKGMINALNEMGTYIWEFLQTGPKHLDEIVSEIKNEYSAPVELIREDIKVFIEQLKENGIVILK